MADDGSARHRQQGLQQAASVIFALVAVVPLLIFAYTLNALGVIGSSQAQLSLGLALAVALLGFWMFRSMLGRMSEMVQALAGAVEQAHRARRPTAAPSSTAAVAPVAAPTATPDGASRRDEAPASVAPGPSPTSAARRPGADRGIPGVGSIREIAEVERTMDLLWQREAAAHAGKRVQISVANSREPLVGTISEVSDDGLILDQADGQMAVAYRRVTGIDRVAGQG